MTEPIQKPTQQENQNQQTEPKKTPRKLTDTELKLKLLNLLDWHSELRAKLLEALNTDHFFITVSCQKTKPGSSNDLQHYHLQHNYPANDVVNSLKHIAGIWTAKMNPTGDVSGADGWV